MSSLLKTDAHGFEHQLFDYRGNGGGCSDYGCLGGMNKEDRQMSFSMYTTPTKKGGNYNDVKTYLINPENVLKGGGAREGAGVGTNMIANPITGERLHLFMTQEQFEGNKQLGGKRKSSRKGRKSSRKGRKSSRKGRKSLRKGRKSSHKGRKSSRKGRKSSRK